MLLRGITRYLDFMTMCLFFQVELSVYDGHLTEEEVCAPECKKALDSTMHERHYMGPGVQRIPVRYGKVRGTLFLPAGILRIFQYFVTELLS